ncbi:hypothetical protein [Coleofasciculus sp. F4-SAH-05]|uniref:hypothetical protein n=1 Tax=Coleofasciculus sp. F4-SAH-05 TaxID=3069525 RepID=UPI0032F63B14
MARGSQESFSSFVIRHLSFVIRHLSFVIRHSSFVIRHLSFVICKCKGLRLVYLHKRERAVFFCQTT